MRIAMRIKSYAGPYAYPRRAASNLSNKNIKLESNSPLKDRLLYLAQVRPALASCKTLPQLQEEILEYSFQNFRIFGKSLVSATFWIDDKIAAFTVPQNSTPNPRNMSRYMGVGRAPSFPIQPETVQEAIETRGIVHSRLGPEEFLAAPLVNKDQSDVFGILLFSNRYSIGKEAKGMRFTENDIEIARAIAEDASEAISRFLPDPAHPIFGVKPIN